MIATASDYADFKSLRAAFTTVGVNIYYFDDTVGSGNFFIYGIYWAGGDAMQVSVAGKPATFGADFPFAVKLMSAMALS